MPLYRCFNCDKVADHPAPGKCVPCGLDPATDPRADSIVIKLETIHFDPPHATVKGWGLGHAACDPTKKVGTADMRATGERDHVNCPRCRESAAFAAAEGKPATAHESVKLRPVAKPAAT
ncbi:MAG TPA: hypothetical protein VD866_01045 [Urbifossiella sp.]|nr:hypothetical protein [Urbifossiella sp.]